MEDTLRVVVVATRRNATKVLILVLMEDTLRGTLQFLRTLPQSLNPCFNGRYSQSILLRYN